MGWRRIHPAASCLICYISKIVTTSILLFRSLHIRQLPPSRLINLCATVYYFRASSTIFSSFIKWIYLNDNLKNSFFSLRLVHSPQWEALLTNYREMLYTDAEISEVLKYYWHMRLPFNHWCGKKVMGRHKRGFMVDSNKKKNRRSNGIIFNIVLMFVIK